MDTKPIGFVYSWVDASWATEMLVGFAITTFIAICLLRFLKHQHEHPRE